MQGVGRSSTPLLIEKEEGKPTPCFSTWSGRFLQGQAIHTKNAECLKHRDREEARHRESPLLVKTTDRKGNGEMHVGLHKAWRNSKALCEEEEEKEEEAWCNREAQEVIGDVDTLVTLLMASAKSTNLASGTTLHANIIMLGLFEVDLSVGNALVYMYAKCGAFEEAQDILDDLPVVDVALWNVLFAGYVQHGLGEKALSFFDQMQQDGPTPDTITLTCVLKACGIVGAFKKGQEIHAQLAKDGLLEEDVILGTALVDMYIKFGLLGRALELFDELLVRDVITWNVLITGYAHQGCFEEAFNCFGRMQLEGFLPNRVTFIFALKACGSMGALNKGQAIHARIVKVGLPGKDVMVANALIDMYAKCGSFTNALRIFSELSNRDVVSWNAVIGGYAQHMHGHNAVTYFVMMQEEGFAPDGVTFACALKACGSIGAIDVGQELHADIVREGLLERDKVVANALLDMYAKVGLLEEAQEVFDELSARDVVSWTALITGYVDHNCCEDSLGCFERMQHEGIRIDSVAFISVLKACGVLKAGQRGQQIHALIVKDGFLGRDVVVGTAIVDMYAKCGTLAAAQQVFDGLLVQNLALWNALVNGYAQQLHEEEALTCFEQMQLKGFTPDSFTFVCICKACGSSGAVYKGLELHDEILREGLLESCLFTGNALVDMYGSWGMIAEAQEVFDSLPVRDVVSWNALIQGYAQLGGNDFVFDVLEKMTGEGEGPDRITFTSVLNACSHRGLLEGGQMYFESMSTNHAIVPILEHQICMVDLLGRAGHLHEALAAVRMMSSTAESILWHTFMSACQKHGDVELGRWAFRKATAFNEKDSAAYVCMSDIHAAAGP